MAAPLALSRFVVAFFVCLIAVSLTSPVLAQTSETSAPDATVIENPLENSDTVDAKAIEAGQASLAANDSLDAELKTSLQDLYQQAKQNLSSAEVSDKNIQTFESMATEAPARMKEIRSELDSKEVVKWTLDPDSTVESIKQQIAETQLALNNATAEDGRLTAEPARRQKRLAEIPTEISAAEKELKQVAEQINAPALSGESAAQTQARMTQLRSKRQALQKKIEELKKEQSAYLATSDLLPLQRQLSERKTAQLRSELDAMQSALTQRQRSEVADTMQTLRDDLQQVPEALKPLAQSNIEVTERQQKLVGESARAQAQLNDIQKVYEEVKNTLDVSQDRLEAVGLTDALGLMLRNKRRDFEELRTKYRPRADLQEKIQEHQISVFELEDEAAKVEQQIAAMPSDTPENDPELMLLRKRKELLASTIQTQNSFLDTMLTADTQRHQLRSALDEYIDFVDQNVFWIRSAPIFSTSEFRFIAPAAAWLVDVDNWQKVFDQLLRSLLTRPLRSLIGVLVILTLVYYRSRLRHWVREFGDDALRTDTKFSSTASSLLFSIVLACIWPAFFGFIAWSLLGNLAVDPFVAGVGNAFAVTAIFVASRELIKEVCRDKGLAQAHFGWDDSIRKMLRFHLRWYTVLGGTLIFLMMSLYEHPDEQIRATASRLTTIALFLVTATFNNVIFSVNSPIFSQVRRDNPDSKAYRWRRLIWLVLTGFPIVFAGLALAGFLDTAFNLGRLMQTSFLMLVMLLLVMALAFRWLSLRYRDVARRQARELREKKLAAMQASAAEGLPTDIGIELQEEDKADLPKLDRQTRQLVYVMATVIAISGLALIWSNVLPAIEIFDRIVLWRVSVGENMDIEPVTLRDLLYSIGVVVVLVYSARNLPGLLELFVLRKTSLDSGARYALTTILRYTLTVVGAFVVLNILSVPWTQLGWLLAAASVGLGFGLQEIVANFVSGIILLLERPVRVGDIVTIDDTTGVVSRIQMRATTVTSWERKELVVPNKDLITGKILNWSLTNVINRLSIEVGVDYDADPNQVREILERVVSEHPDVMDDPAPLINFESFGDSSLNFAVRFYLATLDRRVGVTHEVNTAIIEAFRAANISIPFPQRDVNFSVKTETMPLGIQLDRSNRQR
ncbi:membrane protein containing Mechanosensitive ion channel MscS domain protein [Rhodopirellula maiorica SM1]|uniref:Membrane protein containing Mechanosensitive ion channel MscS domain protein n=1 Tax=Rhodopirellula maiorica SM1 TaxID=1265738 RepID=M5RPU2_9BACT|nr:membrane protein containing Mechanosensitive ion channel MscS domain protein [Rhodopirellula maiorica SM1]